jgi:hypothetical protein
MYEKVVYTQSLYICTILELKRKPNNRIKNFLLTASFVVDYCHVSSNL